MAVRGRSTHTEWPEEGTLTTFELTIRVALLGLLVLLGVILVLYGTSVRNTWGVNVKAAHCPQCNAPAPGVRIPMSLREFLWGGWTCRSCGTRVDKWGREIPAAKNPSVAAK
jgi:hypothetical protein